MSRFAHVPYTSYIRYPPEEMQKRSQAFRDELIRRRTIRQFSSEPVPREVIENCLLAAGTAPNGANLQPWHFVVVGDPEIKRKIREEAEREEYEFYHRRAPKEWLDALEPFGTDEHKPYLEDAPYVIVIFGLKHGILVDGRIVKNYYVTESVGIATGFLISALHHSGLATLTHTPSPMGFLNKTLNRPEHERPFLVLVTGYPDKDASVPVIQKKTIEEIATFIE
jgi:iodotyrosine deiodinase